MSVVTIRKCDICGTKSDDHAEHIRWGRYQDCNGREFEVCAKCASRLFKPWMAKRERAAA